MTVDIRPCDMYDLKYIFLKRANSSFRKNIKFISYNMDQYCFFGDESNIFFQITLINCSISKNFVQVLPTSLYKHMYLVVWL